MFAHEGQAEKEGLGVGVQLCECALLSDGSPLPWVRRERRIKGGREHSYVTAAAKIATFPNISAAAAVHWNAAERAGIAGTSLGIRSSGGGCGGSVTAA